MSASLRGVTCIITLSIFLISTQFFILKMDHFDFSLAPLLHRRFTLTNQRRVFVVSMTLQALRHAHWITSGLRRKGETSSVSRPRPWHSVGSSRSDWWKSSFPTSNHDSRRRRAFSPPPPPSKLDLDEGGKILRGRLRFPAILENRVDFHALVWRLHGND